MTNEIRHSSTELQIEACKDTHKHIYMESGEQLQKFWCSKLVCRGKHLLLCRRRARIKVAPAPRRWSCRRFSLLSLMCLPKCVRARWKGVWAINCSTRSRFSTPPDLGVQLNLYRYITRATWLQPMPVSIKTEIEEQSAPASLECRWFIWNATTLCVHHSGFSFANKRVSLALLSVLMYTQETHRADGSVEELQTHGIMWFEQLWNSSRTQIFVHLSGFHVESAQYLILNNYRTPHLSDWINWKWNAHSIFDNILID